MSDANEYHLSKVALRAAFEQAAESYDQAAVLQREVATRLDERLAYIRLQPQVILDLGVGTGFACELLVRRYPRARLLAMDIAIGMLQKACQRQALQDRLEGICADMENLPLADHSVDLIFSNLTLQWSTDLDKTFSEFARVLRPGGLLMFTSFGPDTLLELRNSWSRADGHVHVNAFMDMHDVGDALLRNGLAEPVMDNERIIMTYENVLGLMRDLKSLGARNANVGRSRSLTGKGRLELMLQSYESYRQDGRLPATYEVIYGHAWAPVAKTTRSKAPVSEMRRAMRVEFDEYLRRKQQQEDEES
jgi:malonyl-CoA O-methyltransferase